MNKSISFALLGLSFLLSSIGASQDKSGSKSGLMKLPDAGGTVTAETGSFTISSNKGASQYSLPLPTLPSRANVSPLVSINYNQFAGDQGQGFGIGWSLSVPSIDASTELGIPLAGTLSSGEFRNYLTFQGQKLVFIKSNGDTSLYRLKASEQNIQLIFHKNSYTLPYAREVDGYKPWMRRGFEVIFPDGQRQLFTGDLSIAEGNEKIVTRYVLAYEVSPNGESIAYNYTKDAGRSYLTDISFAGGASRYHFDLIDGLGHLRSFAMGHKQESRKLYAKLTASFKNAVQAQWCLAYIGRKTDDRSSFTIKAHEDCLDRATAELSKDIDPNSLSVLDELQSIYRFGSDSQLGADTLRLPTMSFAYSSWSSDKLAERQLVYPMDSLVDSSQFSVRNYELADVNHDGLVDALRRNSNGNTDIFYSTGDLAKLFKPSEFWTVKRGNLSIAPDLSSDNFHFADLNGDSFVDLLQFDASGAFIYLGQASGGFVWSGSIQQLTADGSLNAQAFSQGQAQFVDINNDGKSDVLTTALDASGRTVWKVYLNLATQNNGRWDFKFSPKTFAFPFPTSNLKLTDSNFRISDINGDQLPDIVLLSSSLEADQSGLCAYLNLGKIYDLTSNDLGFGESTNSHERCGQGGRFIPLNGLRGMDSLLGLWLADVNGDGILDVATMGDNNQELLIWLGYGDLTLSLQPLHLHLNLPVKISSSLDASRSRVADIDGDGQAEILIFDDSASGGNRALMIDFNRETDRQLVKSNLLTTVDFESGLRYDIRYATSTTERQRDLRLGLETSALHFPVVIAKQLISSQGIPGLTRQSVQVQEFFYHKPYYDPDDKEFLGFSNVETLNYGDNYAEESSYTEDSYYTYATDPGARKLAGKLKSKKTFRILNDIYFQKQAALTNVFNPADASTHSWLDQSATQSLPAHDQLIREENYDWQTVEADLDSYYIRQVGESTLQYDEELGIKSKVIAKKTQSFEDFDAFNFAQKIRETVAAVEGPFSVSMPEVITETQLSYEESRAQLSTLGIINLPDYQIVQRNGEILDYKKFSYDERGQKSRQTSYVQSRLQDVPAEFSGDRLDQYERFLEWVYDGFGNQTQAADNFGIMEDIAFDADGIFPISRRLPKANPAADDQVWRFAYLNGRLDQFTTPLGLTTHMEYDLLGRRSRMGNDFGSEQKYSYKPGIDGNPTFVMTELRRYKEGAALGEGETSTITQLAAYRPDGTQIAEVEDASRGLKGIEKGIRVKSFAAYDRNKRKIFTWTPYTLYPSGSVAEMSVKSLFRSSSLIPTPATLKVADPRESSQVGIATWYDFQGRVREERFPSGLIKKYSRMPWGFVAKGEYSQQGKAVAVKTYQVESESAVYAIVEEDQTSMDAHITRFDRDNLGNLQSILLPGESKARILRYDNRGLLEYQSLPGLGSYTMAYDQRDRLIAYLRVSEDGQIRQKIEQTFDSLNRLTAQYLDGQLSVSNTFDIYPEAWNPDPAYNKVIAKPIGLLAESKTFDVANGLHDYRQRLAYDPNGRVVYREAFLGAQTYGESYRYLLDGSMKNVKNPMNMEGSYILDEAAHLRSVKIRLPGAQTKEESIIEAVSYNGKGQIEQILYRPIGDTFAETDLVYDEKTLQVSRIKTQYLDAGKLIALQDLNLSLDSNNNILAIEDLAKGGPFGHVDRSGQFAYNWKNELIRSTRYNKTLNYDYSSSGSFKKNEEMGPGAIVPNAESGLIPQGVAGQTYRFDGFGQLKSSPTVLSTRYSATGQLVFVETKDYKSYFGYNQDGERIYKKVVQKSSNSAQDSFYPMKSVAVEPKGMQSYIFIGDSRLVRLEAVTGEWYYYLKDHLGSSDFIMHSSGKPVEQMLYQSYGTEESPEKLSNGWTSHLASVSSIIPKEKTHHRFTGHYFDDDTGLYYMNARYYDAKLGRFIQPDPFFKSKPEECLKNPRECNLYIYAKNNPLAYVDPTGLWSTEVHNQILDKAFARLPGSFRDALKAGSCAVDACNLKNPIAIYRAQFDWGHAPQHSMLDPGMTKADGEARRETFMAGKAAEAKKFFGIANEMRSDGKWLIDPAIAKAADAVEKRAWQSVGEMLHPVMDSTSPAHQDGSGKGEGWGLWKLDHKVANHGGGPTSQESSISKSDMDETQSRIKSALEQHLPEVARGEQNKIKPEKN